ncbi:platelet glycoprotein Ib alpha chain-like [Haliotis rubra]|uniref:platelet glycoprotein Ib alpha chain-like n=1 Tax=Haliotis rubra TaxID=36100 RepID=UPI001EE57B25|nr:platelet glycoprotein Ib alpha chain-like [Haliotis rubra]
MTEARNEATPPPTTSLPTTSPSTTSPLTTSPLTTSPPTTPPPTTSPPTTSLPTTSPTPTPPPTTSNTPTTSPTTTSPPTTPPPTTSLPTTSPQTTSPPTTSPLTTSPPTTPPPTTLPTNHITYYSPPSTSPPTTSPLTTSPPTTPPPTTLPTNHITYYHITINHFLSVRWRWYTLSELTIEMIPEMLNVYALTVWGQGRPTEGAVGSIPAIPSRCRRSVRLLMVCPSAVAAVDVAITNLFRSWIYQMKRSLTGFGVSVFPILRGLGSGLFAVEGCAALVASDETSDIAVVDPVRTILQDITVSSNVSAVAVGERQSDESFTLCFISNAPSS